MKRIYFIILSVVSLLVLSSQPANAQFFRAIAKALGVSDDSPWMAVADGVDQIGNAAIARRVDNSINKYGGDAVRNYDNNVNGFNERKNRELNQYLSDVDKYKMEYCISHGLYDYWVQQYGDDWFERRGREWFDNQNEAYIRRGDNLLPWHLRGDASEETRYRQQDDFKTSALGVLGLSTADAERGNRWVSGDKFDKQDMVIDAITDVLTTSSPNNAQLTDALSKLIKVNNQYNKDKGSNNTEAITKRNIDLANIIFDAAWEKNENRKQYVSENLNLTSVLSDAGFEDNTVDANVLAGVVLSIQNNDSMTQEEKNQWYQDLGIKNPEQAVVKIVNKVNSMTDKQIAESLQPVQTGPTPEEIAAREDAERRERERIEKENAISSVNQTVVDSYNFDVTDLTQKQKDDLDKIADVMQKYGDLNVEIKGHTCNIGYKSVNKRVGLRRAETAKNYLISKGILSDRISIISEGEESPVVENSNADNRKANRRIEFEIQ